MKTGFFSLLFLLSLSVSYALPFNSKLTEKDMETLNKGEVLIKNIEKLKNASLQGDSEVIQRILKEFQAVEPNYLAEVIQIRPYSGNENLKKDMREVLENVQGYAGIPYWSVQHERYFDLYETAEIVGKETLEDGTVNINADLYMSPFGMIHTPITILEGDDYLIYISGNTNTLEFKGFDCVKKGKLKSVIALFRDGDSWILYGLGGCRAPRIAMFQKRIETSFINRIKTFLNFVYTKI